MDEAVHLDMVIILLTPANPVLEDVMVKLEKGDSRLKQVNHRQQHKVDAAPFYEFE